MSESPEQLAARRAKDRMVGRRARARRRLVALADAAVAAIEEAEAGCDAGEVLGRLRRRVLAVRGGA